MIMIMTVVTGVSAAAQSVTEDEYILRFLGADSLEEIDEESVAQLSAFLIRPLRINLVSQSRLVSSGLMNRFQAASLIDYRMRHGDVLSVVELSLIDGFSVSFAEDIAPFVSFESHLAPGQRYDSEAPVRTELSFRSGMKYNGGLKWGSAFKTSVESGGRMELNCALTSPYGYFEPDSFQYTASMYWNMIRFPCEVFLGDFNARFGQGLVLWNGLSLGSMSSPRAYMRNPTGLSRSSSFTGSSAFTGVGCEISLKTVSISAFLSFPDLKTMKTSDDFRLMPALNISWSGRKGQISMTNYAVVGNLKGTEEITSCAWSSIDTRWCLNGYDIFAEIAYDWKSSCPASLTGILFPIGRSISAATSLRWFPSSFQPFSGGASRSGTSSGNEYGVSLSSEFKPDAGNSHRVVFALDAAHFPIPKKNDRGGSVQMKGLLLWEWKPFDFITLKTRLSERLRTWGAASRTDLRTDIITEMGDVYTALRVNALKCAEWGLLSYLEAGYRHSAFTCYLRLGLFRVDDWEDRIYVYERDAPGSFNVPAYYGRGVWTAAAGSFKFSRWGKLYIRAAYTSYPFMPEDRKKPGRAELKIQFVSSF